MKTARSSAAGSLSSPPISDPSDRSRSTHGFRTTSIFYPSSIVIGVSTSVAYKYIINIFLLALLAASATSLALHFPSASALELNSTVHVIVSSSGASPTPTSATVVHRIVSSSDASSTPGSTSIAHSASSTETGTKMSGDAIAGSTSTTAPFATAPPATSPPPSQQDVVNSSTTRTRTVQSVTVVVITPTSTETTTVSPESTFSKPVAVTFVQGGMTSVGTPPLVTILSTATYSNGSVVTWTQVYANPTADTVARPNSFFQNTGAVAGVFAVIGIIAACLLLCILYFIRRIHRARRESRWHLRLQSMRHDHESDFKEPFHDRNSGSTMHSPHYGSGTPVDGSRKSRYDVPPSYLPRIFSGIKTITDSQRWSPDTEGPFPTPAQQTDDLDIDDISPRSTPSIYPTTLPPIEGEVETAVEISMEQPVKWIEMRGLEGTRVEEPAEREIRYVTRGRPRTSDSAPIEREIKQQVSFAARDRPRTADSVPIEREARYQVPYAARDRPRTADSAPPRPPKSALRSRSHSMRTDGSGEDSSSATPISPLDFASHQALHTVLKRQTLLDVRPRSAHADVGSTTHPR